MIELTPEQLLSLENVGEAPTLIVNPNTKQTFVLLSVEEYERLKQRDYDDSPWTREEREALAWKVIDQEGWEEYDEANDA